MRYSGSSLVVRHLGRGRVCIILAVALAGALFLYGCCGPIASVETDRQATAPADTAAKVISATAEPSGPAATLTWQPAATDRMVVSADGDNVYIRSKPDMEAKVKAWPDGTEVVVLGQEGEWCHVQAPDGYVGYMPARYLAAKPGDTPGQGKTPTWKPAAATKMFVSAHGDNVYIRSKPDMEAKVKAWPDGTEVVVLGEEGDWYCVRAPDGYVGFMPSKYLAATPPDGSTGGRVAEPKPQSAEVCRCSGDLYNCDSFSTETEAQACFDYCMGVTGRDVHRLDRDEDGLACEPSRQ